MDTCYVSNHLFGYDVTLFVTGGSTIGGFPLRGSSSMQFHTVDFQALWRFLD